jgi:hypothetical protein
MRSVIISAVVAVSAASSASAQHAIVDQLGGDVIMNAGSFGGTFTASPTMTDGDLTTIGSDLVASGITLDDQVTFLLANTDAGITFITLIDELPAVGGGGGSLNTLGFASTVDEDNLPFINDNGFDNIQVINLLNGTQLATGAFQWDSVADADGHAWGNLKDGDFLSYNFFDVDTPGLGGNPFQFLSFNGDTWDVVANGSFSANNQFVFTAQIVPAPGAIALLGVAGLLSRRGRRRDA